MTERLDPTTSIAIAVVEHDDRLLIGPRPAGTVLAGYWEFPGGKLVAGESPEDGAVRECWEETGLRVRPLGVLLSREYLYPHGHLQLHFVHCLPVHPSHPPTAPFIWVPRCELWRYRFPAGNDELLCRLAQGPFDAPHAEPPGS